MDERRVGDYFVVAGLPDQPEPLGDFSRDGAHLKATHNQAPITDVAVIFPGLGEDIPPGFSMIEQTPTGFDADLNHGSLRSPEVFLCYRRGQDRLPLVDIGVMYEGKERIMSDSEVVMTTPGGRVANVNNSGAKTFVTYRRAPPSMPCNELVVTDICVILTNKGEVAPHAFCMINKNLNKGMVGSDVYLCYKKSMNRANLISYKPGILARYPHVDHKNFPLPATVPMFCLPMGSSVECWPATATQPRPVFSTFVLTVADAAEKVYGSAITFYERIPADSLTSEQCQELQLQPRDNDKTVNVNKCICLLSHWPFFDTFEKFLLFLYELVGGRPQTVPIERHISHFLEDVPFPSPQRPGILVQLSSTDRVILMQPEDLPLPRSGAGFRDLLMNLGPDNCLMILLLALTEQKLLVHSLRPDVLTAVAEAVSMIIFPFKWQCPYIPLCPLGLAEVLHAPLPFLIGVDSRFFDLYDPPGDVNCVDLDTNNITVCEEKRGLTAKLLPKKPARILRNTLEQLFQKVHHFRQSSTQNSSKDSSIDRDFQVKRKEQNLELEIQEAFLRFMANVLKGYRVYLLPITKAPTIGTTDPNSLFDLQGFLRSRDKTHHKFFTLVMKTQMFIRFIEERSFVSDMDASWAFFDECTEKVDTDDGDGRLLELDDSHQSERTVFILPPEPTGLPPGRTYTYKSFVLDPLLFSRKEMTFHNSTNRLSGGVTPGSPMARRTKHEIKSAQKLARKHAGSPELWAKCLLTTCYSLWFIHLPSYAMLSTAKAPTCLQTAYEFLVKIQNLKLQPTDEVCYRVMMQLCGLYSRPVLAVKLLTQMKRSGIQPNAITYGFYNRAVLEATWPNEKNNSSQLLWNKLRNVIIGVAQFRRAGVRHKISDDSMSLADGADIISRTSLDSGSSHHDAIVVDAASHEQNKNENKIVNKVQLQDTTDFEAFDRFRSRVGSIVRPSGAPLLTPRSALQQQTFESSAGLLMTGLYDGPTLSEENDLFDIDNSNEASTCVSPSNGRRRNRSGSCSEFMFGLRQGHLSGGSNCQGSPQSPRSPDTNSPSECFKLLIRSESFANDAQILDKLNRIKLGLPDSNGMNGRVATIPEGKRETEKTHAPKPSSSRSLFGRRSSFTYRRTSRESSTENLEERSSAGSTDDLDSTGSHTPKHSTSKLFSGLGDRVSRFGSAVWERTNSRGNFDLGLAKSDSQTYLKSHNRKNSSLDSLGRVSSASDSYDLEMQNNKKNALSGDPLMRIDASPLQEKCDNNCDPEDLIMNRTNDVYGSPSKSPNSLSCKTSPIRTPVTENDPLGALDMQETDELIKTVDNSGEQQDSGSTSLSSIVGPNLLEHAEAPGGPVLFAGHTKTRGVSRSATFGHDGSQSECSDCTERGKCMQRSSTMPVDVPVSTAASVTSGLGSIGSSFKLPFSRYSPARLSLRKADLRIGTQIIENAITNFSPSSLTSKNELIRGGLSTLKSATNLISKKIEEVKEAISANSTPVKANLGHGRASGDGESLYYEDDTGDGERPPERRISSEFSSLAVQQHLDYLSSNLLDLFGEGSRKGSSSNLQPLDEQGSSMWTQLQQIPEQLYPRDATIRDQHAPVALELLMTTCSKCHNCSSVLHDEEILAGWVPEDSNLNTKCQFCGKATVPFLTVHVTDYRTQPMMERAISQESMSHSRTHLSSLGGSSTSVDGDVTSRLKPLSIDLEQDAKADQPVPVDLEPITVPYLNPLVLRKEFENILHNEGDSCLTDPRFVDEHPIIYWNMVWVFQRICVVSHLPGLCLQAASVNKSQELHPSWENCDHNNVAIRCMWDNRRLHEEVGQPMYALWQQNEQQSSLVSALLTDRTSVPRNVMQMVISSVRCNDLLEPLKKLAIERQKLKKKGVNRSHSIYRDILFLAFTVMGRDNIDHFAFDREYMAAYERLSERDLKMYQRSDKPPSIASLYCRHYFKELEL